jgi:environmental stress-induced protein Ves
MRIIRSSDHRTTPWKNGGGVTTEIALSPLGAGLDAFEWRVSMARVESDGPFSVFPGIDRVLSVIAGAGLTLEIGSQPPVTLTVETPPFAFAADLPTRARLLSGPITDLNVMVRRGLFETRVTRLMLDGPRTVAIEAGHALMFCLDGELQVETPEGTARLAARDAIEGNGSAAVWRLRPETRSLVLFIEFWPIQSPIG